MLRRIRPFLWVSLALVVIGRVVARNFARWRQTAAPQSARDYVARLWLIAGPALLAPAVVFLFGPHTIFANNAGEFAVPFQQLAMPWLLKTVVTNWLLLFALGCILACLSQACLAEVYAAILFAFGIGLWGQGNLWNADYGVLAGQEVDLAAHAWRAPYELGAFLVALLLAAIFFRPVSRIAPFAALVFHRCSGRRGCGDRRRVRGTRTALAGTAGRDLSVFFNAEHHPHRARRVPVRGVRGHPSAGSRFSRQTVQRLQSISAITPRHSRRRR